uniref:Kinesin 14-IV protein n=1 Tax=Marsilea vestita TaxID=59764 RepID=A0A142KWD3_MARVE|nr:kinesin 14-IV protein [Marsilea vestita]
MLLPKDLEKQQNEPFHLSEAVQNLRKSIHSLLGAKEDLTSHWVESVRFIIDDLSTLSSEPCSWSDTSHGMNDEDLEIIEHEIHELEDELDKLRSRLREEDSVRSSLHNRYLDLKGNVRVFCRIRPPARKEQQAAVVPSLNKIHVAVSGKRKIFELDKVFLPASTQDDVFAEVSPLVRSALDGHNVCVFAYGQTGAGKTFTMEGNRELPGIVPRTLQTLFHQASSDRSRSYIFTFSMLELYMGSLRDLLVSAPQRITDPAPKCLSIQMDVKGWVEIENLSEFVIKDAKQARKLYRTGSRARATACTNSNEVSSRSHCLIRVTMACTDHSGENPILSKLWLVDLGGSERLLKTNAKGQILEEGKAINLSLTALGDVISALQKKQPHIPYRNSKLTQILRDSLGEDAKTVMLVHVSPSKEDAGETVCSLTFATRARGIHLGKELSEYEHQQRTLKLDAIKQQLEKHERNCEHLQDNILELQFLQRKKKEMLMHHNNLQNQPPGVQINDEQVRTPLPTIPEKQIKKRERRECKETKDMSSSPGSIDRPRFMTQTTSSRLKGRHEVTNHVSSNVHDKNKTMKDRKHKQIPERSQRYTAGCNMMKKAAKVAPVDIDVVESQQCSEKGEETQKVDNHQQNNKSGSLFAGLKSGFGMCSLKNVINDAVPDVVVSGGHSASRMSKNQVELRKVGTRAAQPAPARRTWDYGPAKPPRRFTTW